MTKHPVPFLAGLLALTVSSGLAQQPAARARRRRRRRARGRARAASAGGQAQGQGQGQATRPRPGAAGHGVDFRAGADRRHGAPGQARPRHRRGRRPRRPGGDDRRPGALRRSASSAAGNYTVTALEERLRRRHLRPEASAAAGHAGHGRRRAGDGEHRSAPHARRRHHGPCRATRTAKRSRARSSRCSAISTSAVSGSSRPRAASRPTIADSTACSDCRPATTTSARRPADSAQMLGRGLQQLAAGIGGLGGRGGPAADAAGSAAPEEPEATGYAPTYYPGVVSAPEAGRVTVAPGQEVAGIDFQIQLVPFATVSGVVAGADDIVPVMLMPQDASGNGPLGGQMLNGRIAGRRHVLDLQRAARPLHRGRAFRRTRRRRSENRHAGDRRQRPEHRRRLADACSRR